MPEQAQVKVKLVLDEKASDASKKFAAQLQGATKGAEGVKAEFGKVHTEANKMFGGLS